MGGGSLVNDAGRVSFVDKGDYSSSETYNGLDFVSYEGAVYVAKKITSGNPPAYDNEFWRFFVGGAAVASIKNLGIVKPDNITIGIAENGTISAIILDKDGELESSD